MDVEFGNDKLDRLETDPSYTMSLPHEIVRAFRRRMQSIRSAKDERDLRAVRGNRFKQLEGTRSHQYSIRLNDQWRLIVELHKLSSTAVVRIVTIEDYH